MKLSDFNPDFPTKVDVKKNINNKDVTFPVDALLKTHNNAIDQADCELEVDAHQLYLIILDWQENIEKKYRNIDVLATDRKVLANAIAQNITKVLKPVKKEEGEE